MLRSIITTFTRSVALVLLVSTAQNALAQTSFTMPDINEATIPILDENFTSGLNRYDGHTGLWSTRSPRGGLMTNAEESVFLDPSSADAPWSSLPPTISATPEGLSIRTIVIPEEDLEPVRAHMREIGQGKRADQVRYATGRIATVETWAQTYGWFEIDAQIPRGRGRWPAFWLITAGPGWPPEIDIFEAYGEGIAKRTRKDGRFNTAVWFDDLDPSKQSVHNVDIINPYDDDPKRRNPRVKKRLDREVYSFMRIHFEHELEADIYGRVNTYAAFWTPNEIVYYFGPDRDNLREIYRAPTPDDAHDPMLLIANDQFTARGGWWPADDALDAVLAPENDFLISGIRVRAWRPDLILELSEGSSAYDPRSSIIRDTTGDDIIAPHDGFDIIELSGGADEIRVRRGRESKVISGFGSDDVLVLEGFPFIDSKDAHARLTQVGKDAWLSSGADPFWPQSIIFRDKQIEEIDTDQIVSHWPIGLDIWATRIDLPNRAEKDIDRDGLITAPEFGGWIDDEGKPILLIGGTGPDRFMVSNPNTRIRETENGNIDTMIARGKHTLHDNVERGILRGTGGRLRGTSGNDRLEAEGKNGQLSGEAGDDLYVIAPEASKISIRIEEAPGNDRLRGFGKQHSLLIAPALRALHADWQIEQLDEGVWIRFNETQSLLIEGIDLQDQARIHDLQ